MRIIVNLFTSFVNDGEALSDGGERTAITGGKGSMVGVRCVRLFASVALLTIRPAGGTPPWFPLPNCTSLARPLWCRKPQSTIDDDNGEKMFELMELLNDHDDVQNVHANFEMSDALTAKMGA
jgi:hypothetical protein